MHLSGPTAERALAGVIAIFPNGYDAIQHAIDAEPVPIYLTDADGRVLQFNKACIKFAGRRPVVGQDQWCVTWRLHTVEGERLPHSRCPMAVAIREKRPIRGASAVAERPDGSRVTFAPFPTPIFLGGTFAGAVNVLIDLSTARQIETLREQADRCRRLAETIGDGDTAASLRAMAEAYAAKAQALEGQV